MNGTSAGYGTTTTATATAPSIRRGGPRIRISWSTPVRATLVRMPVVWTRRRGAGRIFFSALGHGVDDLREPTVHTLTTRGLLWAAR